MPKTSNPKNTDKQSANGNDADTKQQAPAMNAVAIEEILMDEHALNELVTTGLATDELVTDALRSCLQASWNSCHLGITAENQYTQQLGEYLANHACPGRNPQQRSFVIESLLILQWNLCRHLRTATCPAAFWNATIFCTIDRHTTGGHFKTVWYEV